MAVCALDVGRVSSCIGSLVSTTFSVREGLKQMPITRRFRNPDTGECEVFELRDFKMGLVVWIGTETGREVMKPADAKDEC